MRVWRGWRRYYCLLMCEERISEGVRGIATNTVNIGTQYYIYIYILGYNVCIYIYICGSNRGRAVCTVANPRLLHEYISVTSYRLLPCYQLCIAYTQTHILFRLCLHTCYVRTDAIGKPICNKITKLALKLVGSVAKISHTQNLVALWYRIASYIVCRAAK